MIGKMALALALSAGMAAQAASPASAGILAGDAIPGPAPSRSFSRRKSSFHFRLQELWRPSSSAGGTTAGMMTVGMAGAGIGAATAIGMATDGVAARGTTAGASIVTSTTGIRTAAVGIRGRDRIRGLIMMSIITPDAASARLVGATEGNG